MIGIRFLVCFLFLSVSLDAQDDLLSLLGDEEETTDYTSATFKTTRVINLQSIEHTAPGVLDLKIQHRFGFVSDGIEQIFGLDNATIRIGADLGLTPRFMTGFGRSGFQRTYDVFAKYKLLRQSTGKRNFPFSTSLFASAAIQTAPFADPDRENFFSSRLFYSFQAMIARKFNDKFSLQLSPTIVHRNLVTTAEEHNDVAALGIGMRQKISKRVTINLEYIYVLPGHISDEFTNSFSIGCDIETGGHVFQLHFTNSTSMVEKGFVAETRGRWGDQGVHFGFNLSRVFNVFKPKQNI